MPMYNFKGVVQLAAYCEAQAKFAENVMKLRPKSMEAKLAGRERYVYSQIAYMIRNSNLVE